MSDKIFLDTNIIVYAFDAENVDKKKISLKLLNGLFTEELTLISTQVIQEFCSVALTRMNNRISIDKLNEFIATFPEEKIEKINLNIISKALLLKKEYKFSFWDSLIISSAINARCNFLYSEDMSHGQKIENLKIINPYKQ